jgi:hypothetical protein
VINQRGLKQELSWCFAFKDCFTALKQRYLGFPDPVDLRTEKQLNLPHYMLFSQKLKSCPMNDKRSFRPCL